MHLVMPGLRGWPRPWIDWLPSGCCLAEDGDRVVAAAHEAWEVYREL